MGIFEDVIAQSSRKPEGLPAVIERRRHPRLPMLRTSRTSMTSHLWELELVPAFGLPRLLEDIDALAARALDGNIFFEADIMRSAWPRLTSLLAPKGCWMLCLWETIGEVRRLRLFMPVRLAKTGLPRHKVLEPLSNEFMPVGTPLIDAGCGGEAAEMLLRLLGDPALSMPPVVDFTHLVVGTRSFEVLEEAAESLGLAALRSNSFERASLSARGADHDYPDGVLPRKAVRDYARQLRRMTERGKVEFVCVRDPHAVLDMFEDFVTLELRSWKGRRGTAMYNHKKIAAFSRQIVAELAARERCEIHTMRLDGWTVATLIMLGRDGHFVPWKMAFDERFRPYSPGVQVMMHATRALLDRSDFVAADSLAVGEHWMMNRLWPDRINVTDLAVEVRPGGIGVNNIVAAKERLARWKAVGRKVLRRG